MALRDQNRDKASADLLRRTLASQDSAPGSILDACPEPDILAAYAERTLDADETAHYDLHFAQCATCRDQLAAMARAAAPSSRAPRISWIWNWGWIALAPVTAVLLIAAIFIARRPVAKVASLEQQPPLVAMSRSSEPPADSTLPESVPAEPAPPHERLESNAPPIVAAKPTGAEVTRGKDRAMAGAEADTTAVAKSEAAQPDVSPALTDKKLSGSSVTDLPLASRNYTELRKLPQAPAAQPPAAQKPRDGVEYGNVAQQRAQSQTVTVESAAATPTTAAPAPQMLADNSAGVASAAAPNKARQGFVTSTGNANGAVNQMVVIEAPLDRSGRTLVQSPDPHVLWRISGGRYVERSADAGATWHTQWTNATAHVVAGSAPSADTCWLVGRGGIVLLTTDANKWHTIAPPAEVDFTSVSASDGESATITTADGHQFKTRDGGKHWALAP